MFVVVVTPPSSEPTSTTSSQACSPKHSLSINSSAAFTALSVQPEVQTLSISPPVTNRAHIPHLTEPSSAAPAPTILVTPAPGDEDTFGMSAAALAMARQVNADKRLGHTARPPADPALAAAARTNLQQPASAEQTTATPPAAASALSPASSAPASPRQSMFGSSLSLAVLPPSPRGSLSTSTARPRPSPLSALLFNSNPPASSPPSPRTLNSPSYRHPSRLFPQTVHTDKRGYLLPPRANADLPRTLEGKGDSFWIDEQTRQRKEAERERRGRKGRAGHAAVAGQKRAEQAEEERDGSEEAQTGEWEDGVVDVVRVESDDEGELQWHEVIDAVLNVGGAMAKEKQRRVLERRKKGLHRRSPSSLTIEHVEEEDEAH